VIINDQVRSCFLIRPSDQLCSVLINRDHIATTSIVCLGAKLAWSRDFANLPIREGTVTTVSSLRRLFNSLLEDSLLPIPTMKNHHPAAAITEWLESVPGLESYPISYCRSDILKNHSSLRNLQCWRQLWRHKDSRCCRSAHLRPE